MSPKMLKLVNIKFLEDFGNEKVKNALSGAEKYMKKSKMPSQVLKILNLCIRKCQKCPLKC